MADTEEREVAAASDSEAKAADEAAAATAAGAAAKAAGETPIEGAELEAKASSEATAKAEEEAPATGASGTAAAASDTGTAPAEGDSGTAAAGDAPPAAVESTAAATDATYPSAAAAGSTAVAAGAGAGAGAGESLVTVDLGGGGGGDGGGRKDLKRRRSKVLKRQASTRRQLGVLEKQGARTLFDRNPKWKERFFELATGVLKYYYNEEHYQRKRGSIRDKELKMAEYALEVDPNPEDPREFHLVARGKTNKAHQKDEPGFMPKTGVERVYKLRVKLASQKARWMQALAENGILVRDAEVLETTPE